MAYPKSIVHNLCTLWVVLSISQNALRLDKLRAIFCYLSVGHDKTMFVGPCLKAKYHRHIYICGSATSTLFVIQTADDYIWMELLLRICTIFICSQSQFSERGKMQIVLPSPPSYHRILVTNYI